MKRSFCVWQLVGFGAISILGTLLHFLYDWSGNSWFVGIISAVNESIWEHMKLLFFPLLAFSMVEYWAIGRKYNSFWCVKLLGSIIGLSLIPVLYYSYTGIWGKSLDWINIGIFYVAAATVFRVECFLIERAKNCKGWSLLGLIFIGFTFVYFTFRPPHIPLFQDPVSGSYGYCRIFQTLFYW